MDTENRIEVKSNHKMPVRIPYHLKIEDLKLDPAYVGSTMDEEMLDLNDHYVWADEQEMYHIFLATVLLHERTRAPLGECLRTAKVMWRG